MSEPHERLDQAMEERRLELRMSWTALARKADISPQALRSIRRGEYRPSRITARALDDALEWGRGSVERILDDGEPVPRAERSKETRDTKSDEEDPWERLDRVYEQMKRDPERGPVLQGLLESWADKEAG
ncbi:MAG: helix-turn-helix transcriptional regulator [Microbispora sp.]|nr:helix-turn-helix transcriptional regulator [Microbispora sp.]